MRLTCTIVPIACLSILGGVFACGTTGHVGAHASFDPPGSAIGPTTLDFEISNDGTTTYSTANSTPPACVEVTWTGADGSVISTETIEIPGSGQVPTGAVRYEVTAGECLPEEFLFSGGSQGRWHQQAPSPVPYPGPKPIRYHVFGGPILPNAALGEENVSYSMYVFAYSNAEAHQKVKGLINRGIGSNVPPGVVIHSYSVMEATPAGAKFITASNKPFDLYTFGFNGNPVYADLTTGTNVVQYQVNGWDVLETMVPFSDFDYGVMPGVWYENTGDIAARTTAMSEPVYASYALGFNW